MEKIYGVKIYLWDEQCGASRIFFSLQNLVKMENFSSGRLYIDHSVLSDRGAVYSSYFVEYRHRLGERSTTA